MCAIDSKVWTARRTSAIEMWVKYAEMRAIGCASEFRFEVRGVRVSQREVGTAGIHLEGDGEEVG